MRRAIGLIAGPERPPVRLLRRGVRVSTSIDMARKVFTRLIMSAPASAATFATLAIEVTLGESFTMRGRLATAFASLTRYSSELGSAPKVIPPACTLGQDTFNSYAETPSA